MAQEYYNLERAAEVLRISTGEVNRMREQSQLHAFRDGSNWKFRKEDVEEALANLIKKKNQAEESEEEDILTFGIQDEDEGPTLIADANLADTDDGLLLDNEDSDLGLGLAIDEMTDQGEEVGLAEPGPMLEDDDLVLGGSSDLNLSGDSGLSLADDDAPVFSVNTDDDAVLELDEDSDILAISESEDHSEVPTMLGDSVVGNDFDLVADDEDADESESSSQVIALDDDSSFGSEELPDFGSSAFGSNEFGGLPDPASESSAAPNSSKSPFGGSGASTGTSTSTGRSPFEAEYSGLAVVALGLFGIVPVSLAGIMVFDLVRNIASWDNPAVLSSPIMNMIAGILGWK